MILVGFDKMLTYEDDPRSNANPSVISCTFVFLNVVDVYYDILSILWDPISFLINYIIYVLATRECKVNDPGCA